MRPAAMQHTGCHSSHPRHPALAGQYMVTCIQELLQFVDFHHWQCVLLMKLR